MYKTIMAVDPGIAFIGVAWASDDGSIRSTTLAAGKMLGFKKLLDLVVRLHHLSKAIQPDVIVFEDYGFSGKFFNVGIAEFMGVVKQRFTELPIKEKVLYSFLAPTTVKKIAAGNGRAKKTEVGKALKAQGFNLTGKSVHEVDALAVLLTYLRYEKGEVEQEISRKIRGRTHEEF